jgi:hypothetical protein
MSAFPDADTAARKGAQKLKTCQSCMKSSKDLDGKLLNCSGCEQQYYCSKECQIADWPQHKVQCKATRQCKQLIQSGLSADQSHALEDYHKWMGSQIGLLTSLTADILTADRYKTNFVHWTTEYRPELRVRFQLSEQYDVPQIDSRLDIRQALEEFVQKYEQGTNKAPGPMRFFILVLTCSNVPNLSYIQPCVFEDEQQPHKFEPAAVVNFIRELNSGEVKDSIMRG